jgi:methionyl-tRNA synthetase
MNSLYLGLLSRDFLFAILSFMTKRRKVFIGVAWPYVNGDIHIGHLAGYLLPADIFARFQRLLGNDVLMVSGSDCFGTPITLEADKRGLSPRAIVNKYHPQNLKLFRNLKISFDIYTKTATANHKKIAQDFFLTLLKKGFIFKDKTYQFYSPEEKRFLPDRYVEGACPFCQYPAARSDQCDNCGRLLNEKELLNPKSILTGLSVELRETEHYFLDWPKIQPFLEKYIASRKNWRDWVLKETEGWLKRGLKPRPITRDLEWGVEIPAKEIPDELKIENINQKRIYVWFEAVIGYLSASIEWSSKTGRDFKDFWYTSRAEHYYFMGKDNLVFHTLFWPGQLHAYNEKLHLPDFPAINQFLNLEGQKFSKSRGVIIDSDYMIKTYGLDPVRFYLALIMPEHADSNFSWADFVSKVNDLLIGNLGNFINRTLTLARNLSWKGLKTDEKIIRETTRFINEAKSALRLVELRNYVLTVLALADFGNKYLSQKEPWLLKEKNNEEFRQVMFNAVFIVLGLLLIMKPLFLNSSKLLEEMLGLNIVTWPENEKAKLKTLIYKAKIKKVIPLFKKIDEAVVERERAKLRNL